MVSTDVMVFLQGLIFPQDRTGLLPLIIESLPFWAGITAFSVTAGNTKIRLCTFGP